LALFGRWPPEPVDRLGIPASENLQEETSKEHVPRAAGFQRFYLLQK
jgi:hypothetical protein